MSKVALRTVAQIVFCMGALGGIFPVEPSLAQEQTNYTKHEYRIPMRDGITLYTAVYAPQDKSQTYPILLHRTPYGCAPYGQVMPDAIMYNQHLVESGYIFVFQDLRSRSMSDGDPKFENLKPVYRWTDPDRIDEVTDTTDTIDWLLANIPNHNDRVGMFGSSYMGTTSLLGAVTAHPQLRAVLAAAPSVDIYFEDFNRNGLFTLAYTPILDWFGTLKDGRHEGPWWSNSLAYWADGQRFGLAKDSYQFFLQQGALSNFGNLIPESNYFWQGICEHPNYDSFRRQRNMLQYLRGIQCPVLIVGGWHDEQNLYGIIKSYEAIESQCSDCDCRIVVGPWTHSGHKRDEERLYVGDVYFGDRMVQDYQENVEFKFFEQHLKSNGVSDLPEAVVYDTGAKEWHECERLGGREGFSSEKRVMFLDGPHRLVEEKPTGDALAFEFVSDPAKPVPYVEDDEFRLFPSKEFMTADQRFASKRPDVLTFVSAPVAEDMCVFGGLTAKLFFSTTASDADLIVKLIDVYPMDRPPEPTDPDGVKMNGYQQLVRVGQLRGRYRNSYSNPEPFVPGHVEEVEVELLDVSHTFQAGHQIMLQIQSSMFPLFDRNPQKYVDNIYRAVDEDFTKATHRIHGGSSLEFEVLLPATRGLSD